MLPSRPPPEGSRRSHWPRPDPWFLALCLFLFVVVVFQTAKDGWGVGNDIWEHAAAAREFSDDPLDPGHPLFAVDRPHQFMSPYAFATGLAVRVTGASVVTVMNCAGFVNLALLLTGFWLLVTRLTARRHAPIFGLLFLLFLWGPDPWKFGGFFHLKILPFVVPYPSTFAMGLALLALSVHLRFLETGNRRLLVATALMTAVVLLVHPVSAIVLFLGVGAFTVAGPRDRMRQNLLWTGAALAAGVALATLWPFFSLLSLLFGSANEHYRRTIGDEDRVMYVEVLRRVWPALIVVPFFLRRLVVRRDGLALWFAALVIAYAFGWRVHNWSYGRLIAGIVLVGALVLADERTAAAEAVGDGGQAGAAALRWIRISTVGLVLAGVVIARNGFSPLPAVILDRLPATWVQSEIPLSDPSDFAFLRRFAGNGQVVLSDGFTPFEAPITGAKSVAVPRGEAFVVDIERRNFDLSYFFNIGTPAADRRTIIERYGASFLLLQNQQVALQPERYMSMFELGPEIHRSARFVLIAV